MKIRTTNKLFHSHNMYWKKRICEYYTFEKRDHRIEKVALNIDGYIIHKTLKIKIHGSTHIK